MRPRPVSAPARPMARMHPRPGCHRTPTFQNVTVTPRIQGQAYKDTRSKCNLACLTCEAVTLTILERRFYHVMSTHSPDPKLPHVRSLPGQGLAPVALVVRYCPVTDQCVILHCCGSAEDSHFRAECIAAYERDRVDTQATAATTVS